MIPRHIALAIMLTSVPVLHAGGSAQLRSDSPPYMPQDRSIAPPPGLHRPPSPEQRKLEMLGLELDNMNFFWVAGLGVALLFNQLIVELADHDPNGLIEGFLKHACGLVASKIQTLNDYPHGVLTRSLDILQWYGFSYN